MSLEQAVKDNTTAVAALTAVIQRSMQAASLRNQITDGAVLSIAPAGVTVTGSSTSTPPAESTATAARSPSPSDVKYADVAAAVGAFVRDPALGRDKMFEIFKQFGIVKSATEIQDQPEKWQPFLDAVKAAS